MRTCVASDDAISPVMATVLLAAIVIILSAAAFVLMADFQGSAPGEPAPVIALANADGELRRNAWNLKTITSSPVQSVDNYLFILRTPGNGTLVAQAPDATFAGTLDMYFQLGPSAGTGMHNDNGTTVGADGLGGFHIRLTDTDGDGRFGGGDRIDMWYDGDGDQAHQNSADDLFPSGTYEFEIKHRPSESYVALELRNF